ncbi:MAG: MYXO-CTERM sorting domain-containing protein [Caldilineaceae bacterium]
MRLLTAFLFSPLFVVIGATEARATCNGPSCNKTTIISKSCAEVSGDVDSQQSFYFQADCEYYCDPQMGPEHITHSPLDETNFVILKKDSNGDYSQISGAFVVDGQCDGLALYRFNGSLEPDTNYGIQATSQDYPGLELIVVEFKTAPATSSSPDGGAQPDSGLGSDGATGQSDSGLPSTDDNGGCSMVSGTGNGGAWIGLFLLVLFFSHRRRSAFR